LKTRLRLKEYAEYLQVYDLRKAGRKFREIGEQLSPESEAYIEAEARDRYQRGEALVLHPPLLRWRPNA
jgi:hypothetical protein